MKELFLAFSKYNKKTNDIIFSYLQNMSYEQIGIEINTYYNNIAENVFHVINSDIKWLKRLAGYRKTGLNHDMLDKYKKENELDKKRLFENMDEFCGLRSTVNDEIIELIKMIPENQFMNDIELEFGNNKIVITLWKLLLQWFNHHTHHRGQISVLLDINGIDNDYSLVLDKIE